jgi:Kef-type K+ transport system membrane component KefB
MKQPSVIAEVISGILLGPTVMGRVKGFSENIFPPTALPIFNAFANIGLIFFMNLIGLELDFDLMVAEWKRTAVISVATMVIPFIVSIGSSLAVWQSIDKNFQQGKSFGTYLLFMYVFLRPDMPSSFLPWLAFFCCLTFFFPSLIALTGTGALQSA